jgi:thioredoxin reductase (NADPH)
LTSRAVTQARKFNARTATPYRALSLEPGNGRHLVRLEDDKEIAARAVLLATGVQYRKLPVDRLAQFEGLTVFYATGAPEGQLCAGSRVAIVGGGNSAGQAAVWLARGGALITLLHRRADLRETMSDYLVHELERFGVAVRGRSEIAALHGDDGHLAAVALASGERLPFSFLFLFLGAHCPAPSGSRRPSAATTTASSSPGRRPEASICSRPTCPACSLPATSARARPNGVPPP